MLRYGFAVSLTWCMLRYWSAFIFNVVCHTSWFDLNFYVILCYDVIWPLLLMWCLSRYALAFTFNEVHVTLFLA